MSYLTLKLAESASLPEVGTLGRWPANPPDNMNMCLPTEMYWWGRSRGQTALCAMMCQDRGAEVNNLLEMGPGGHSILMDRARQGFNFVATTLEDCFRPGWPGSYAMSHGQAETMLNFSMFCFWLPSRIGHLWSEEEVQESNTWPTTCLRGLMIGSFNGLYLPLPIAVAAAEAGTDLGWPGWSRSRALQHFELLGWPKFQTGGLISRWAREELDGSLAAKRMVVQEAVTSLQGILLFNGHQESDLTAQDHIELGFHLQGMLDQVQDLIDPMEPLDFGAGPAHVDLVEGDSGMEDGDGDSEPGSEAEDGAGDSDPESEAEAGP